MKKEQDFPQENKSKISLDISKKSVHDIIHFVNVLKKLEKEGKIRIRVVT